MEIISIFTITNYRTGQREEVKVEGAGQKTVEALMNNYSARSHKFVLEAFEINGREVNTAIYD